MASDEGFVDYIVEKMSGAGRISSRKMFGEYAVYCGEVVVALVCDNQLFVKPTSGGRALLGSPVMAPPYQGASLYFLIDDGVDDREALSELIRTTLRELPAPKPRNVKKKKTPKARTAKVTTPKARMAKVTTPARKKSAARKRKKK